MQILITCKSL